MDDNKLKAFEEIGQLLVDEIKAQIQKANKIASGSLLESIRYVVNPKDGSIEIDILGEPYLLYVDKGRRPGLRMIPTKPIEDWLDKKNIKVIGNKKSVAFAISKSIQIKGIPATNIIQKAINNIMLQVKIILVEGFGKDLAQEIVQSLKQIKQK